MFLISNFRKVFFNMSFFLRKIFLFLLFLVLTTPWAVCSERTLDVFDFATTESARPAWDPGNGASPVELFEGIPGEEPGLQFPCNFETVDIRCYWDYSFTADLSSHDLFTMRVFVEEPVSMTSLTLYFRSPGGWFANTVSIDQPGWQTLRFSRGGFHESSSPTGWDQITGIRFSVWKGASSNTAIIATNLRLYTPPIKIIKGSWTNYPDTAERTAELIGKCLDAYSIDYGLVTDEDVLNGEIGDVELVMLPYNKNQPEEEIDKLRNFVDNGGKLIAFFLIDSELADAIGIDVKGVKTDDVRAMQFIPGIVDCMPSRVEQDSWSLNVVSPKSTDTQILAFWENAQGAPIEDPAWLISSRGAFMTHVLLSDDIDNKERMMLSLVAHFVPEVREEFLSSIIANIMPVGQYNEFDEAVKGILEEADLTPRLDIVQNEINLAKEYRSRAMDSLSSGMLCQTLDQATSSRLHLLDAYYRAQRPVRPEFRALWESDGTGVFPGNWDKSAKLLKSCGFDAVIPIMFTAGMAHYDSEYLPHSFEYDTYGDQPAQFVAACKKHGIEAHPRKQTWNLLWTEQSFIDEMRSQGRTQVDVNGDPVDWLCPSDPRNYQIEFDSIMELVNNYDIDGIHYDNIRYSGRTTCYCDSCRDRFTSDTGHIVENWPDDCYDGPLKEEYREWRREQINRLVRDLHDAVKAVKPDVKISAAVFSSYPSCRDSVAQDWVY